MVHTHTPPLPSRLCDINYIYMYKYIYILIFIKKKYVGGLGGRLVDGWVGGCLGVSVYVSSSCGTAGSIAIR